MRDYHRQFTLWVATVLLVYGVAAWFCLPYATFHGDLTRMGMLPETDFGWTRPQPAVNPAHLVSSSLREADVVVIGDSFSESLVWQSVLVAQGLRVTTLIWGQVPAVCGGLPQWLAAQGFRGHRLILQSVEWKLAPVLKRSLSCTSMADVKPLADRVVRLGAPPRSLSEAAPSVSGKMSVGIRTAINRVRLLLARADGGFTSKSFGDVTMRRLERGCELFSNRACSEGLFLNYEREHGDYGVETVAEMKALTNRLSGLNTLWLIVPDKSTTYLRPEKVFWQLAGRELDSPDVLADFRRRLSEPGMLDLYKPNDSHLSTAGYLELGRLVSRNMAVR